MRALAERMISISDNTATDHLLYTVGRERVEAALQTAKHAKPELDIPFLSTRELFLMKLEPTAIDEYLKLPAAKRRVTLDKTLAGQAPRRSSTSATWTTARRIDKLEWFASSTDLCRAMATLWTRAQDPGRAAARRAREEPGRARRPQGVSVRRLQGRLRAGRPRADLAAPPRRRQVVRGRRRVQRDEGGTVDEDKAVPVASALVELAGRER